MREQSITLTIESRLEDVPVLGTLVNSLCCSAKLSAAESSEVELCVVEAVNNVIKHAYLDAPGHSVGLVVSILPDRLIFDVFDSGRSADPEVINADHSHALEIDPEQLDQVAESGRGIAIMQQLMDSVEYTPGKGRNRLRMVKRFKNQDRAYRART